MHRLNWASAVRIYLKGTFFNGVTQIIGTFDRRDRRISDSFILVASRYTTPKQRSNNFAK